MPRLEFARLHAYVPSRVTIAAPVAACPRSFQSGEVPNWDARLTSLVAIATYTFRIGRETSLAAIDLLSACAICWINDMRVRVAEEFFFLLAVQF